MSQTEIEKLLRDYLNYLEIERNRSPKTRENYERYLREFLKFSKARAPKDITEDIVREFRLYLARPQPVRQAQGQPVRQAQGKPVRQAQGQGTKRALKKITQGYYIIALRNFLKYLLKRDVKVLAPEKIELPKIPERQIEILEYGDLERLLAAPTRSTDSQPSPGFGGQAGQARSTGSGQAGAGLRALRDKAILETFFSTGLRLSELCKLDRYIDLKRGELSVRGKGDKLRVVFLADSAKEAIKKYLEARTDTEKTLFVSLSKSPASPAGGSKLKAQSSPKVIGPITPRAVQRMVEARAKEAGIAKKVHPHMLRHGFATDLLINGADLRSVQELLGHSNISTTQVYTHLTNKELREVHRAFHARRRK